MPHYIVVLEDTDDLEDRHGCGEQIARAVSRCLLTMVEIMPELGKLPDGKMINFEEELERLLSEALER